MDSFLDPCRSGLCATTSRTSDASRFRAREQKAEDMPLFSPARPDQMQKNQWETHVLCDSPVHAVWLQPVDSSGPGFASLRSFLHGMCRRSDLPAPGGGLTDSIDKGQHGLRSGWAGKGPRCVLRTNPSSRVGLDLSHTGAWLARGRLGPGCLNRRSLEMCRARARRRHLVPAGSSARGPRPISIS